MMKLHIEPLEQISDFREKATQGVAITGLFLLTPFVINNLFQGRLILGVGSLIIMIILAVNAWNLRQGRYYPALTLFGLVPVIILFLMFSLRTQGIIGVLWCYPALLAFYFMLPERMAWIVNAVFLCLIFPVTWTIVEPALAARIMATLLAVSIFSTIFIRIINGLQIRLKAQATIDPLTGVANRMLLQPTLEQAIQQSERTGIPMALITLDLDRFKAINDTLGHDAGDAVLRGIGAFLQQRIRGTDKVFRLGGEEFLVLLYNTDAADARQVAEELRRTIPTLGFLSDRQVTTSIGVATLHPGEDWTQWMKRSDQNLYRAKSGGRDQVVA